MTTIQSNKHIKQSTNTGLTAEPGLCMNRADKNMKEKGFTLIEMTIVIIVMGLLSVGVAKIMANKFTNSMEDRDRTALALAKEAIISYAISNGGIPDPVDVGLIGTVTTPDPTSLRDIISGDMPPPSGTLGVPAFGVNNWGAYGNGTNNPFRLVVNSALTSSIVNGIATGGTATTGGDRVVFCQAVHKEMVGWETPPPVVLAATRPATCQNFDDRTSTLGPCAATTPKAFILYSAGNNRSLDQENDETSTVGTMTNNLIFENDSRGINNVAITGVHYDDQVMSYPLSAFASDCRNSMNILSTVMSCAPGEKYVKSITNKTGALLRYTLNTVVRYVPDSFTAYENKCWPRTTKFQVDAVLLLDAPDLTTLDANNDGLVDVLIRVSNTPLGQ